jgi:DNA (cytosine-5)-methyltransferase 1
MLVQTTKGKEFGWLEKIPTPTASDHKRTPMKEVYANRPKTLGVADDLAKWAVRKSGLAHARLEPALWEWAMGWPQGWTELKPLEMDKCLYVQQQPGNC